MEIMLQDIGWLELHFWKNDEYLYLYSTIIKIKWYIGHASSTLKVKINIFIIYWQSFIIDHNLEMLQILDILEAEGDMLHVVHLPSPHGDWQSFQKSSNKSIDSNKPSL